MLREYRPPQFGRSIAGLGLPHPAWLGFLRSCSKTPYSTKDDGAGCGVARRLVNCLLLRVEKLYQDDLVAPLAVDEFVGNLFDKQDAKTAGPHSHLVAELRMAKRLLRRIAHRGMRDGIQGEAGAGVANLEEQHARRSNEAEFDFRCGIESASVLYGVAKQLIGRKRQMLAKVGREVVQFRAHKAG